MKLFNTLVALPLLTLGLPALASTVEEALDHLYAYVLHDFDGQVFGPGKGHVGAGCIGSTRSSKRCTINEFVNFVQTGTASENPSYYNLPPDYIITADVAVYVTEALAAKVGTWTKQYGRIVPGVKSDRGLRSAMTDTVKLTIARAKSTGVAYEQRVDDLNLIMGFIVMHFRAKISTDVLEYLKDKVRSVTWRTRVGTGLLDGQTWVEIQWDRMLELYPTLADPNSALSKEVRDVIKTFYEEDEEERTAATLSLRASANVKAGCLR
ncbi:hypothetical protein B0T11DRAFT_358293 [Plectosphaerella cucumerina]|uniref:Uncharacterized protein n=1 Tax=Plectosphaerella cucumerina TaxID=40658 RepID=A0A8K0TBE1_9PEZI|nr:hypothetical protein B0T11DRAFT_358293 [Plectosphaerella cucumerina]